MPLSPEIIQAAQLLGSSLHQSSAVQSYLDQALQKEQAAVAQPISLFTQQVPYQIDPGGQLVSTGSVAQRPGIEPDICCLNTLFSERDQQLEEVRILFTHVADVISSVLTVDYRSLVGKE